MPTGYTSIIAEKETTFPEFALGCARAFGALMSFREEPMDAPIPDKLPISDYYTKRIAETEKELEKLKAMTSEKMANNAKAEYDKELANYERRVQERTELKNKYLDMLSQVENWQPPTSEHQGLKEFMIQQLTESIRWDCSLEYLHPPKLMTKEDWYNKQYSILSKDLIYNKDHEQQEINRVKTCENWIKALKESL